MYYCGKYCLTTSQDVDRFIGRATYENLFIRVVSFEKAQRQLHGRYCLSSSWWTLNQRERLVQGQLYGFKLTSIQCNSARSSADWTWNVYNNSVSKLSYKRYPSFHMSATQTAHRSGPLSPILFSAQNDNKPTSSLANLLSRIAVKCTCWANACHENSRSLLVTEIVQLMQSCRYARRNH